MAGLLDAILLTVLCFDYELRLRLLHAGQCMHTVHVP